ncbi:MAG: hypothetical protein B9S33_04500 [Pedosphaera sp. Tous-C6FEB]|nr:MAG: hypothetical protein B9S33_04500 [Pedosphaera sp. Tous-C6FEB]
MWRAGTEAVASFGTATLHRRRDGRYELRGGTAAEQQEALDWASICQHDAVFPVLLAPRPPARRGRPAARRSMQVVRS